jgi:hypothetical protein
MALQPSAPTVALDDARQSKALQANHVRIRKKNAEKP